MLLIDVIGHMKNPTSITCFIADNFNPYYTDDPSDYIIYINSWFIVFSYIFNAFARVFLDVAIYEFICITSPRDLIGLVVGTFYTIKGISQLFAIVILLPFNSWSKEYSFPSCGFAYFLTNIGIALVGLMTYMCIARKYYRNLILYDPDHAENETVETIA